MKAEKRKAIAGRLLAVILSVALVLEYIPLAGSLLDFKGEVYAAAMPADGTGWTASGTNGLKYFQNIYGSSGNQTQVTSLSYNQELTTGVYYIMNSITLQPTSANLRLRTSALRINGNVKLIFLNNSTLTVQGGRAYAYNETYKENGSTKTNYNIGGAGAGIQGQLQCQGRISGLFPDQRRVYEGRPVKIYRHHWKTRTSAQMVFRIVALHLFYDGL